MWKRLVIFLNKPRKIPWPASYAERRAQDIASGISPDTFQLYVVKVIYDNRFSWSLLLPASVLFAVFLNFKALLGLASLSVKHSSTGPIMVGLLGLPLLVYVWFLRAYERDRELSREEMGIWSNEFSTLIETSVDKDKPVQLRQIAIRQLQDYLVGAKWQKNQASNTAAIFKVFSLIIDERQIVCAADINRQEIIRDKGPDLPRPTSFKGSMESDPLFSDVNSVLSSSIQSRPRLKVTQDNLSQVTLNNLNLGFSNFAGFNFSASSLKNVSLIYTELSGADLSGADLTGADLTGADLSGADLFRADLSEANLSSTDLSGADLLGADLSDSHLINTNLSESNLEGANLSGADLTGVDFSGADLTGVDFSGADLSGVDFSEVDFSEVDLSGADLSGANLQTIFVQDSLSSGVVLITQDRINSAFGDSKTILPEGLVKPDHWD